MCAAAAICIAIGGGDALAAKPKKLQVGAAKAEITPSEDTLGPTDSIRDPLYARAIVVKEGKSCAVLVGVDIGGITPDAAEEMRHAAAGETGCDKDSILISATHTHSSGVHGFTPPERLAEGVVEAIKKAAAATKPASMGYGTTTVNLNVNRDLYANDMWYQGINRDGPSDKTLAVLYFLGEDGEPIGVYMNYAMHPIDFYISGVISADFPGEASRYVEDFYNDKAVAVFAQGASGDQNPLLMGPAFTLWGVRTGHPEMASRDVTAPFGWEVGASSTNSNTDAQNAMSKPVPAENLDAYHRAIEDTGAIVTAMGSIIGESTIDVMRNKSPDRMDRASLWAGAEQVTCPGRNRLDMTVRQGVTPPYEDGEPVVITVGLIRIGDVYISTVNGEVYTEIEQRLKKEAPVPNLMMTALANGFANSGYIYSNNASDHLTFQVIGSRLKPGCAEDSIIDASLGLIGRAGGK